ncbi:MAG: fibronectin type III domain-containing protein [Bacteroidia bacterium]|nr:fibronectin type III domain-containing protein [Bacteroidia bacterium]MDW8157790.1 fibronectin type III domain-containing protein [Bacteroidia bacterium]
MQAGSYSVTARIGGCVSNVASTNVVILPAPPTISAGASSTVLCSGQTLSLTSSQVDGARYSWSGPNGFVSDLPNPIITNVGVASTGTYSVIALVGNCASPVATVGITVNQTPSVTAAGNNGPLCVGSTLQLTAPTIPNVSYSWTGPNGFSSTSQNPSRPNVITLDAGTYSVVAISAEGCTSQAATTTVQINQVTTPITVTNNGPLCPGQTLSLSANFINGSTYRWAGPNGFSATTQSAIRTNITEADAGQYTVTATLAGCTSVTAFTNVVVNAAPSTPTVLANTPLCEGEDLNLTTNAIPGATYQWSGPNGFTSTSQLPIRRNITSNDAGLYFLTVRVGNCISARPGAVNVVVNPSPGALAVGNNGPVCERGILQLTASLIPGAIYQWSGPNGFTSNEQNPSIPSVSTSASGTYSVRATLGSCATPVVSTNVIVSPAPTRPVATYNGPVCTGQLLSLTASSIPGATYLWRGPGGYQSVSQNPVIQNVTTANGGLYSLTAIIGNCTSQTSTIFVTVNDAPISITANNNGPVCEGGILNLTATNIAGATYLWVGPNGFRAEGSNPVLNNVRATAAGEYSVTAIVGQCTLPVAKTVVEVREGALNLTAGYNGPLCAGQAIQLTASTITGATYSWFGPGGFNSSAQNPVIQNASVNNSGSYSVTATVGNCVSNVVVVDVVVSRTPATPVLGSNSPVCAGTTMQLTAPVVPTAQYYWSGPNGFSSVLREPFLNSVTTDYSGVYTVVISAGGCSSVGTINVQIIPVPQAPNVNNNGPLCVGLPLNLSATAVPGVRYNWSGPAGFISTSQNPVIPSVSTANAGEYSLVVNIGTCSSRVATTNVVITSPSVVFANNRVTVCKGVVPELTFNLTGQGPWQVSYARSTAPGSVGTLATVNVPTSPFSFPVPSENATYTLVSVVDGNNCSSNLGGIATVTVSDVPMAEIVRGSTICAGNRGEFTVRVSNMSELTNWLLTYRVGNEVFTTNGIGNSTFTLSTGTLTQSTEVQLVSITNTDAQPACSRNLSGVGTSTTIVVNPLPTVVLNSTNTAICAGGSTTMNVTLTGRGPWTLLYNENGAPQAFAIGTATSPSPSDFAITLNPQRTTDYVLTGVVDANDCSANVVDRRFRVTVNPIPTATFNAASNTTCAGSLVRIPIQLTGKGPWVLDHTQNGVPQPTLVIGNVNSPSPFVYELQLTPASSITFVLTRLSDGNNCAGTIRGTGTFVQNVSQVPTAEFTNNNVTICEGERAELFLKLTGRGPWQVLYTENDIPTSINVGDNNSPSPSVITLPVSPNSDRVYTINGVTDASGCSDLNLNSRTIVRVNPRPAVEIVSNASGICPGGNANLTFNVTGKGPWTVIYSANGQDQLPITFGDVNSSSPFSYTMTVNPTQTTVYSVRSLIDGNGCAITSNALVRVEVNTPPAAPVASNNGPRCIGEAIQLNASSVAGATAYYWTGPNGFTASNQNPVFVLFPASAGVYSVVAIAGGCTSSISTTNVVLSSTPAAPTATVQTPVCEGGEIRLVASLVPGARYLWTGPNNFSSTLQNPVISSVTQRNNGIYSIVAISGNCTSSVSTVEVRVSNRPTATISGSPAPICLGQFVALTVTLSGTAPWSISYSENGGTPITVNNINFSPYTLIVTPTATGLRNYTLTSVTDAAACNPGIVAGSATVQVNAAPNLQLVSKTDVSCGNSTGSITVRATGGSGANYLYSIDGINFNNTTGVFTNLSAGNYNVTVREGNCTASLPVTITGNSAPDIRNITLDAGSPQTTVIVTWDAIPNVTSYNLRYRRAGSTDAFVVINTTGNSRTVTGLLPNTTYEFQVQAVCSNGTLTDYSVSRNVTTAGEATGACSVPQGTFVTINSSNSATLSWNAVQSGAVCYIIAYGRADQDPETWLENFAPVPNTTFLVTGLVPGVRYGFRVRTNCSFCSLRSGIRSAYSSPVFFEMPLGREEGRTQSDLDLRVYPNPTHGNFNVKFNVEEATKVQIVITNLAGVKVAERAYEASPGANELAFDLANEAPGLYLMQVKIGDAVETVKILVH